MTHQAGCRPSRFAEPALVLLLLAGGWTEIGVVGAQGGELMDVRAGVPDQEQDAQARPRVGRFPLVVEPLRLPLSPHTAQAGVQTTPKSEGLRRWQKGALIGAGVGAGVGLSICAAAHCFGDGYSGPTLGIAFYSGIGAGIGALIGAAADRRAAGQSSTQPATPAPPAVQQRRPRHWSLSIQLGRASSGPAGDIERAMVASGFADTDPGCVPIFGCLFGELRYPFSATGFMSIGLPISFGVERRLRGPWAFGLLAANTPIGSTFGNRLPFQHIALDYSVVSIATTASATGRGFRASVGPALHLARVRQELSGGGSEPWENHPRLGFLADVGIAAPTQSRIFLNVGLQYRYTGRVTLGPYLSQSSYAPGFPLPAVGVRFNHWVFGVGPGIRF